MKRNRILNKIREFRAKYIDIFVNYTFDLSTRIQFLLDTKSMEQKDLAKALGKSESEISKWLSGSHNFTLKTIAKIEDVLEAKLLEVINEQTAEKKEKIYFHIITQQSYSLNNSRQNKDSTKLNKYSINQYRKTSIANC